MPGEQSNLDQLAVFLGLSGIDAATRVESLRKLLAARVEAQGERQQASSIQDLAQPLVRTGGGAWDEACLLPSGDLSSEGAVQLALVLDPRVPIMRALWTKIGAVGPMPLNHRDLLARLYEDERLLGKPAPEGMPALSLGLVRLNDFSVTDDDLDVFIEDDAPTKFLYESIQAALENAVSRDEAASPASVDDSEEFDDEDSDPDEPESFEAVRAAIKPYSVKTLQQYVEAATLDLNPAWQRKDIWSLKKKRKLIESILLGIPIPSIILQKSAGRLAIIDGKQRLTAIVQYMSNNWKLPRYQVTSGHVLFKCSHAWFKKAQGRSLPDEQRLNFEQSEIDALVFEDVKESRLRQIFHLYNVSGTRLNAEEIRNAVYQHNPIHQMAYVLAGEKVPPPDLGIGDYNAQRAFTHDLLKALRNNNRYAALGFICRYLAYSRAATRAGADGFRPPSTSRAIDLYLDDAARQEEPSDVAQEIVRVFREAGEFFDIDDERSAFYFRDDKGVRRFNKLIATTSMVATRLILAAIDAGAITKEAAQDAARELNAPYPRNQQSSTIWDYQARVVLGLRELLDIEAEMLPGTGWEAFFTKMEMVRLPEEGANT